MRTFVILLSVMTSSLSFAGGINCKQCPAESNFCAPRPDCADGKLKAYNCKFDGTNSQF